MSTEISELTIKVDTADSVRNTQALKVAMLEAEHGADSWQVKQARLSAEHKVMAAASAQSTVATEGQSKAIQRLDADVTKYLSSQDRTTKAIAEYTKAESLLSNALKEKVLSQSQFNDAMKIAEQAYVKATSELGKTSGAMAQLGLNTSGARRDLLQMGKALLEGDFAMAGSQVTQLATKSNILAAAMSPLGLAIIGTIATLGGLAAAATLGHEEMVKMNEAMEVSSNRSGTTRGAMRELAQEVAAASTLTVGAGKEIVETLVRSGRIGSESLKMIAMSADDFANATGIAIDRVGPELVKLFSDPAKGAEELNKQMHLLSPAELEHIAHLQRMGELGEAQLVLAEKLNNFLPKHVEQLGYLETAWNKAKKKASEYWDSALGIGRDKTIEDKIKATEAQIARDEQLMASYDDGKAPAYLQLRLNDAEAYVTELRIMKGSLEDNAKTESKLAQYQESQLAGQKAINATAQGRLRILDDQIAAAQKLGTMEGAKAAGMVDDNGVSEEGKQALINKLVKERREIVREMNADSRALTEQEIRHMEAMTLQSLKKEEAEITNRLAVGEITKQQAEQMKTELAIEANMAKQITEMELVNLANLTQVEKKRHLDKLAQLRAEAMAIQANADARALAENEATLLKNRLAAAKEQNDEFDKAMRANDALIAGAEKFAGSLRQEIELMQAEAKVVNLSTIEKKIAVLTQRALKEGIDVTSASFLGSMEAIRQADQAMKDYAATNKMWDDIGNSAGRFFSDLIMNGKSAIDNLTNMFKQLAADLLQFFAKRWVLQMVAGGSLGGAAADAAGAALSAQGKSPLASLISAGGTALNAASGGFFGGVQAGYIGSPYAGAGAMADVGSMVGQAAQVAAPYLAALAAVMVTYDQYKKWGNDTTGKVGVLGGAGAGAAAGFMVGGPIGAAIGAIIGALGGGRLFGRGPVNKDASGMEGEVNGSTFSGSNWQDLSQRGGLFRGDKRWTETTAMTSDQSKAFSDLMGGMSAALSGIGNMLGSDATKLLEGFTASFKIVTKDRTEAEIQKDIADFFDKVFRDQLGLVLKDQASHLQKYIDGFTGTTAELIDFAVALAAVSKMIPDMGIKGLSFDSLDAMNAEGENVIDTFTRVAQGFAGIKNLFVKDGDSFVAVMAQLNKAFADVGVSAPNSVKSWEAMVGSIDLSTEAGRKLFDVMVGVGGTFKQVQDAVASMVNSIQSNISSIYGGSYGADFAKAALDRAIDELNTTVGNGTTREQTMADLASGVNTQYIIDVINDPAANPEYVRLLNNLLSTYRTYQQATQQATTSIGNSTPAVTNFTNALLQARDGLTKYMQSLAIGSLSPLSPQQRLDEAQRQYQALLAKAKTGDVASVNGLSGAANTYLGLAQQMYASSSLYNEIFRTVYEGLGTVASPGASSWQELFQTALPVGSQMASQADIRSLQVSISDLIVIISNGISTNDTEGTKAIKDVKIAIDKIAQKNGALSGT